MTLRWEMLTEGMRVRAADIMAPVPKSRITKIPIRGYTVLGGRVTAAGREVCVLAPHGWVRWVLFEHFAAAAALGLNVRPPRP